jgi:hypothetical protein
VRDTGFFVMEIPYAVAGLAAVIDRLQRPDGVGGRRRYTQKRQPPGKVSTAAGEID